MQKVINSLVLSFALLFGASAVTLGVSPAAAQENTGSITIPITEYEKLKKATEAQKDKQYWNMTYEQILDEQNGDEGDAWELYEYWVLRRLSLFGTVNGGSVGRLVEDINVLNEIDDTKPITIVVNSPGGAVYNGIILLNAMEKSRAPIHTVCDSLAASMAAVIVAAGDYRIANPGCHWMIHELGTGGAPGGQTTDFVKWADFTVDLENILLQTISDKTGLSMADVRTLGEYETFYGAEEVFRLGVVDEFVKVSTADASRTIPEDLLPVNRMKKNLTDKLDGR